jgi:hypothetical protein
MVPVDGLFEPSIVEDEAKKLKKRESGLLQRLKLRVAS